jgi:hypothetical protein
MPDPDLTLITPNICVLLKACSDLAPLTPGAGGATTSGSAVVTLLRTTGLAPGNAIAGAGIPVGTTIVGVDSETQLTLSANATATATGVTFTFTPDLSAIVDMNGAGIEERVQYALARIGVAVGVRLTAARDDQSQSSRAFFNNVHVIVDVVENTTLNRTVAPDGTGTGIAAWPLAAFIYKALKQAPLTMLASKYPLIGREPGIEDITSQQDIAEGIVALRVHFTTKASSDARASL